MEFHKYSSIELVRANSAAVLDAAAGPGAEYVVQEKVDGCNLQLSFSASGELQVGRRNGWIKPDEPFHGVRGLLSGAYSDAVAKLASLVEGRGVALTVYCELYGTKVLPRIAYSAEVALVILDIVLDHHRLPPAAMHALLCDLGLAHLEVPTIHRTADINAALSYNVEGLHSRLAPPGTQAEGVVVRSWGTVARDSFGHPLLFKIKATAFLEIENAKKPRPSKAPVNLTALRALEAYCCANRALGIVSKEGPPTDKADIGKRLVPALIADARQDFAKDNPDIDVWALQPNRKVLFNLFVPYLPDQPSVLN